MNDEAKLKENTPSRPGRTIALLVDCFAHVEGGLFGEGSEGLFLLRLAGLLASGSGGRVLLLSVVAVPEGHSISAFSTTAQGLRRDLETLAVSALTSPETVGAGLGDIPVTKSQAQTMIAPLVRVAPEHDLAGEVRRLLTEEQDLLLLLPLRRSTPDVCPWVRKALRSPLPCDVAWVRPPLPSYRPTSPTAPFQTGMRILIPARGGPQAQLALDLSSDLNVALQAQVTMLHVLQAMPESQRATEEAPFAELLGQMGQSRAGDMPQRAFVTGDDPVKSISDAAAQYDLLIMGAGGEAAADVGSFTQRVARNSPAALLAIKTRVPVGPAILAARRRARPHALAPEMLSLIVDKWFAENTFHADEFSDLHRLVDIKKQRGVTISVGLPALNEETTIGGVVSVLKKALMDDVPLVDEIVVIDSDSTDRTREIAAELGVPVYIHQQVLPEAGEPVPGKGEALWKSLHVLKGDIIAWVDTDVANMHPQFVYGLIGPLLREPRIGYVKGYYHRPISTSEGIQHEGGGRVTELTVRPLVNLFFPLLSGVLQPLAGEYAGRRELLEKLPFFSGYGVETGMLIDLLESYGLDAIGQVNLEKRIHRNRSLADLSLTAFAIIQVILSRLESRASITLLEEVNRSMKLIRFEDEHLSLEVRKVHDVERPPIITIPAYREARGR
ncbi:MAG TPA: glucosyl-3-phosphoglycerate synthase [Chloroflexia bacterium]|nr:glucosyl-3-phosphoglycerate synthase [Chloroflexia bacterium]